MMVRMQLGLYVSFFTTRNLLDQEVKLYLNDTYLLNYLHDTYYVLAKFLLQPPLRRAR